MHNLYPPQGNHLLWNSHDHIIMDYFVVLPQSSFLSRHTDFKENVSMKHKTVSGHTENPLHWSRGNLTYIQGLKHKKTNNQCRGNDTL